MTFDQNGIETDESLRVRIDRKYGMWGAFLSIVMESQGKALDACAESIGLLRGIQGLEYDKR